MWDLANNVVVEGPHRKGGSEPQKGSVLYRTAKPKVSNVRVKEDISQLL